MRRVWERQKKQYVEQIKRTFLFLALTSHSQLRRLYQFNDFISTFRKFEANSTIWNTKLSPAPTTLFSIAAGGCINKWSKTVKLMTRKVLSLLRWWPTEPRLMVVGQCSVSYATLRIVCLAGEKKRREEKRRWRIRATQSRWNDRNLDRMNESTSVWVRHVTVNNSKVLQSSKLSRRERESFGT